MAQSGRAQGGRSEFPAQSARIGVRVYQYSLTGRRGVEAISSSPETLPPSLRNSLAQPKGNEQRDRNLLNPLHGEGDEDDR
jgi:hypothetical protein